MSERGAFTTEYIYCPKCLRLAKSVLLDNKKYLCSIQIPSWDGQNVKYLPIIAGKIGGLAKNEEIDSIQMMFLNKKPCHKLRIAVICDTGNATIIEIKPDEPQN